MARSEGFEPPTDWFEAFQLNLYLYDLKQFLLFMVVLKQTKNTWFLRSIVAKS